MGRVEGEAGTVLAAARFLLGWRNASAGAYRRQMGPYFAVPLAWGCLDAYALPGWSSLGFLACALFLENRPGRRLALQTLAFVCWAAWLGPSPHPTARDRLHLAEASAPGDA